MLRAAALRSETVPNALSARTLPANAGENARAKVGKAPVEEDPDERAAAALWDMRCGEGAYA